VKNDQVVSQLRLSRVTDDDHGLLVENVVVDKSLRGKGYGRFIMSAAETWALRHQFTTIYLSTPDMQAFYGRLGYVDGEPVTALGDSSSKLNKAQV
jgi:GNAT superfamily N-acetyltransferase